MNYIRIRKNIKNKKEELEKKFQIYKKFNTQFKASVRSEEMYDKQKNIAFEKVFKILDNDKDGKISKIIWIYMVFLKD